MIYSNRGSKNNNNNETALKPNAIRRCAVNANTEKLLERVKLAEFSHQSWYINNALYELALEGQYNDTRQAEADKLRQAYHNKICK